MKHMTDDQLHLAIRAHRDAVRHLDDLEDARRVIAAAARDTDDELLAADLHAQIELEGRLEANLKLIKRRIEAHVEVTA